jgi:hypothetical protein
MRILFEAFVVSSCCMATSLVTMWWLDPKQDLTATQSSVLQEYLAAYCVKDKRHDPQFVIGTTATLSRIVIKTNLANLALAEYAKCKIWIN